MAAVTAARSRTSPLQKFFIAGKPKAFVVLANIDVIDRLRFALLPSVRMRARLFGSIRESLGIIPQAGGAPSRDSRSAPSTWCPATVCEEAEAVHYGSNSVGLAFVRLERMAEQCLHRQSSDCDCLASQGLSTVLDLEGTAWQKRPADGAARGPRADPDHEP